MDGQIIIIIFDSRTVYICYDSIHTCIVYQVVGGLLLWRENMPLLVLGVETMAQSKHPFSACTSTDDHAYAILVVFCHE